MKNFNFELQTTHGAMGGYISSDSRERKQGIVLLPEIFGINNAMRLAADQFAREGFVVLAPDLYSQIEPGVELTYSDSDREIAISFWQRMDNQVALDDARAAVNSLASDPRCDGSVSVVGFCLGGKYALQLAAIGGIDSSVSFYPVKAQDYQAELSALKRPTQVHIGDSDAHIPVEVQEILKRALGTPNALHEFFIYEGAGHGFFNSVRSFGFAPKAAELALSRSVEFLTRHHSNGLQKSP
ncbi:MULTISPECIES: dienelactone hydrolase family protein [Comamonadaceae]|uniref:Carboxymethylenebutenolidase n=1 Tax=Delftia acidovorans TaxID=80866 RepID=G9C9P1_DELAC|nr:MULTISPECIES: dienelactone hydrolase family protein [Comamonadaceae]AEO20082.1 carboxymethylenebutenolidase [Variovorax sp. SRS16]AEX00506.1 carboxymethylenebutenolidase [Delftia acidovorans]VTU42849.1 Carboxymethylenebutenolidase [Variovorax sp. SRS16]VTU42887.1 Carboxymethylenebutenolidase [Variovorax sp. PBL-E5]VTU43711.1 Carboxymethylenebutenolidase [Variovorax sp. PBL-H6]